MLGIIIILVSAEIGENINSINAHLAASRGAGRQFSVPVTIDFSAWMVRARALVFTVLGR
jgi:hypothetical protein